MPRKIEKERTLAYRFPEVAAEWNYEKNGNLTPNDVTFGSRQKVWWKCKHGYEWTSKICKRSIGQW